MSTGLFDWDALTGSEDSSPPDESDPLGEQIPEQIPDDPRSGDDWPHCEVCGIAVEWSGRGRRPKKWNEHKRRTIARPAGPVTTRLSRAHTARLEAIELSLAKQGIKAGAVTGRLLPVTGLTVARRAENFASSLVKICAHKPEYLDALEKVAAFEPVIDILEFLAAVVVAVGVDLGQVHPEGMAAQMLDVTEAWLEIEGVEQATRADEPQPQYEGVTNNGAPKAPMFGPGILPGFTPIGVGV